MVAQRDIQLAEEVLEELRARGDREKATALENIIVAAAPSFVVSSKSGPGDYLTVGQAAQALGLGHQTIKDWVATGQVQAIRRGKRVLIPREALLSYLDQLRRSGSRSHVPASPESPSSIAQREFVEQSLPPAKIERVRELNARIEQGLELTEAEDAEMGALENELAQITRKRLQLWISRLTTARP